VAEHDITLTVATDAVREQIYRIRHAVYATELGQHAENTVGQLSDRLDAIASWDSFRSRRRRRRAIRSTSISLEPLFPFASTPGSTRCGC